MAKYAELPGGKLLKFADDTSDKEMQRAVRRELGFGQSDVQASLESCAENLAGVADELARHAKRHGEAMDEVVAALNSNSSRITAEVADAIKTMTKAQEKLGADLLKAMNAQINLVTKLHVAMEGLNKTMDTALGQSLEAMERSMAHQTGSQTGVASHLAQLDKLVARMERVALVIDAAATIQRTVRRNRDGSYTMQADVKRH